MTATKNYYQILEVPHTAPIPEIKKAYKKLVLRYHPDVSEVAAAEEKFKEVVEAYTTLSDTYKKFAYDQKFRPADFFNASKKDIKNAHDNGADFMEEPISEKMASAVKDLFSKMKVRFAKISADRPKPKKVKVDPALKKMDEQELRERLFSSTNFYVQINAIYALANKRSKASRAVLVEAFKTLPNTRLRLELLRFMQPHDNDDFIATLERESLHVENELAREMIGYLLRVATKTAKEALMRMKESKNRFVREEIARLLQQA